MDEDEKCLQISINCQSYKKDSLLIRLCRIGPATARYSVNRAMNEILGPYEIWLTALLLTFDVQHDVLAAALADPVGGLAHVGAGLRLGDALQHEAEVGEDHAALGGVGQLHALHTEQLFVETSVGSGLELQTKVK